MKSTGIVREMDQLGRIVLPIELRRMLDIEISDSLEFFVSTDAVMLKKYAPGCLFCGNVEDIVHFKGKLICHSCLQTGE